MTRILTSFQIYCIKWKKIHIHNDVKNYTIIKFPLKKCWNGVPECKTRSKLVKHDISIRSHSIVIIHWICPSLNETIDSEFISFISMRFNNNHFALSFRAFCVNLLPHACMHTHIHNIHAEVNRSPHQNDFNCCRLRSICV